MKPNSAPTTPVQHPRDRLMSCPKAPLAEQKQARRQPRSSSQDRLHGSAKRRLVFTDAAVESAKVAANAAANGSSLATDPVTANASSSSASCLDDQSTPQLPHSFHDHLCGCSSLYMWCVWVALLLVSSLVVTRWFFGC